ncbi:hypothetical protein THAOC_33914, partial [Thalassiosira oceanica]
SSSADSAGPRLQHCSAAPPPPGERAGPPRDPPRRGAEDGTPPGFKSACCVACSVVALRVLESAAGAVYPSHPPAPHPLASFGPPGGSARRATASSLGAATIQRRRRTSAGAISPPARIKVLDRQSAEAAMRTTYFPSTREGAKRPVQTCRASPEKTEKTHGQDRPGLRKEATFPQGTHLPTAAAGHWPQPNEARNSASFVGEKREHWLEPGAPKRGGEGSGTLAALGGGHQ